jgi:ABC-type lipoprotein release transport system permease subunit
VTSARFHALLRDVWEGIRSQPFRAVLCAICVGLGTASLTLLMALIAGLREQAQTTIRELGVHVFGFVETASGTETRTANPLTWSQLEELRTALGPGLEVTGLRAVDASGSGLPAGTRMLAVDERVFRVRPWVLREGRPLDGHDVQAAEPVAILAGELARTLKLRVGDLVPVRTQPLRVVGVADLGAWTAPEGVGGTLAAPGGQVLLFPHRLVPTWVQDRQGPPEGPAGFFVRVPDGRTLPSVLNEVRRLIALPGGLERKGEWVTPESLTRPLIRLERTITASGGAGVLLCMLLGAASLAGLLLSSVRERIPEIGLRRALGASRTDIGMLFLMEACLLTAAASLAGTLVGALLAPLLSAHLPVTARLGLVPLAVPVLCGLAVGVLASFWPARSAANIAPSEALRND